MKSALYISLLVSSLCAYSSLKLPCKTIKHNLSSTSRGMFNEVIPGNSDVMFLSENEKSRIHLFERVRPSVVYISKFAQAFNPLLMNVMEIPAQTGTGFVWDDKYIVTNCHVVGESTKEAQVTFIDAEGNREAFRAVVKGVDVDKDVAVLSLVENGDRPKKVLNPLPIGSSENLRVGQSALAIGNPFGLDHTLTTGVVSGLGRQISTLGRRPIFNMIQTDAAINPGNSGGPLLDSMGRLIGMNTAIYSTSGASAGIGFAIPVDTLKAVVETIVRDGKVVRPATGISYMSGDQARMLGIDKGIVIIAVAPGSAAETAGLRGVTGNMLTPPSIGDVIIAINDKPVVSEADLLRTLDSKKVGETIELTVLRSKSNAPERGIRGSSRFGVSQLKDAVEVKVRLKLQPFDDAYQYFRKTW